MEHPVHVLFARERHCYARWATRYALPCTSYRVCSVTDLPERSLQSKTVQRIRSDLNSRVKNVSANHGETLSAFYNILPPVNVCYKTLLLIRIDRLYGNLL